MISNRRTATGSALVANVRSAHSQPRVSFKPIASGMTQSLRVGTTRAPVKSGHHPAPESREILWEPGLRFIRLPDVKFGPGVFEDINPEHRINSVCIMEIGSRGRARTYNPSVNSRLLYH